MNKFISLLENFKKKDYYNGKGIIDGLKSIKLKLGKKSEYSR